MTWARQRYYDFEDGKQAGIAEGAKTNAIENARNLLRMNVLTPEQIAQGTSLPLEEVLAIKKELEIKG